jgi:PiT family inorganic phosphate transporter
MTLFLLVMLAALAFEYINGFHDTANAIATVVSTKVLTPRMAVMWAAFWNLVGALFGTAVAKTISSGLIDPSAATMTTVLAALIAAIIWGLFTWWLGLPSSSSHALIGGLCGAALATASGKWSVLIWQAHDKKGAAVGLWPKVVLPMFTSPLVGLIGGALLMGFLLVVLRRVTPRIVGMVFGKAQLISAGFMGFSHGSNDAQKTMGIITCLLVSAHYLGPKDPVPVWVAISCYGAIALGTMLGGWRIVKTMGQKVAKLRPVDGFCAESGATVSLFCATAMGVPVSTTHTITGSIMGVGSLKRMSAVRWGVAGNIIWAWLLTIPCSAVIAALAYYAAAAITALVKVH